MKSKLTLVVIALVLSLLIFHAFHANAQEVCTEGNPVLRPQYVVGDTWSFTENQVIFERYEGNLSVQKRIKDGQVEHQYLSPDGNVVKNIDAKGKNTFLGTEKPLLLFPLFKGKSWSGTFQFESSNSQGEYTGIRTRKIKVVVAGPETITIAGEAMPACRLQTESYIIGQSNPFEQRETYWYSPRAKKIVKYESVMEGRGSKSYEMKSYTLGRGGEVAEK